MSTNVPAQEQQETTAPAASSSSAPASASRPAASDDSLACQWERCSEKCPSAEALFEHICEKHVGRKSTNNLNLTCGWANCRTTTVKRDHITSHIRVHVPLKPHKCDFCGKSFKRPQDLKKHVKTHADDSVLLRTPEQHNQGGYRPMPKPGPQGYYDHQAPMHHPQAPNYGPPPPQPGTGYYMHQPLQFGPGYYPVHHGSQADMNHRAAYDAGRRRDDVLNEFFGDVKRRQFDPSSYAQVGQRLVALHGVPITGSVADYMVPIPQMLPVDSHGPAPSPLPIPQYALPLPNVRTKGDLLNIDHFLDQMQTTVYENANAAAAAGVQQPGAHYTHQAINFRQSHSPPQTAMQGATSASTYGSAAQVTAPMMPSHSSQSASSGTAALTPPSSSVSHTSGHSPSSSHGYSPSSRQGSATTTYPTLPPVSTGYATHASAAPTSTLATNFDPDPRRRFSGGMLQRSSNSRVANDVAEGAIHNNGHKEPGPRSQIIDPALSVSSPSNSSDSAADKIEEEWIENVRVIEGLRILIKDRLDHKWFEGEDGIIPESTPQHQSVDRAEQSSQGLYPDLRAAMH
ncbi:hypothetical protein B7463_g1518, partial [Scytalidium lignicola]